MPTKDRTDGPFEEIECPCSFPGCFHLFTVRMRPRRAGAPWGQEAPEEHEASDYDSEGRLKFRAWARSKRVTARLREAGVSYNKRHHEQEHFPVWDKAKERWSRPRKSCPEELARLASSAAEYWEKHGLGGIRCPTAAKYAAYAADPNWRAAAGLPGLPAGALAQPGNDVAAAAAAPAVSDGVGAAANGVVAAAAATRAGPAQAAEAAALVVPTPFSEEASPQVPGGQASDGSSGVEALSLPWVPSCGAASAQMEDQGTQAALVRQEEGRLPSQARAAEAQQEQEQRQQQQARKQPEPQGQQEHAAQQGQEESPGQCAQQGRQGQQEQQQLQTHPQQPPLQGQGQDGWPGQTEQQERQQISQQQQQQPPLQATSGGQKRARDDDASPPAASTLLTSILKNEVYAGDLIIIPDEHVKVLLPGVYGSMSGRKGAITEVLLRAGAGLGQGPQRATAKGTLVVGPNQTWILHGVSGVLGAAGDPKRLQAVALRGLGPAGSTAEAGTALQVGAVQAEQQQEGREQQQAEGDGAVRLVGARDDGGAEQQGTEDAGGSQQQPRAPKRPRREQHADGGCNTGTPTGTDDGAVQAAAAGVGPVALGGGGGGGGGMGGAGSAGGGGGGSMGGAGGAGGMGGAGGAGGSGAGGGGVGMDAAGAADNGGGGDAGGGCFVDDDASISLDLSGGTSRDGAKDQGWFGGFLRWLRGGK